MFRRMTRTFSRAILPRAPYDICKDKLKEDLERLVEEVGERLKKVEMRAVEQLEKEYRAILARSAADGVMISEAARGKAKLAFAVCLGEIGKELEVGV